MSKPILKIPQATAKGYVEVKPGMVFDYAYPNSKLRRGRLQLNENGDCICPTLTATYGQLYLYEDYEMEEPKIKQIGSYSPTSACNAKALDANGICPTLLDHKGAEPAVVEPFNADSQGLCRTLKAQYYKSGAKNLMEKCAFGCTGVIETSEVIGSTQAHAYRGSVDGVAPCITANAGMAGGHVPMVTEEPKIIGYSRSSEGSGKVVGYHTKDTANTLHTSTGSGGNTDQFVMEAQRYRIRKLTPRECFRLMDVEDGDIDKMLNATETKTLKCGEVRTQKAVSKSAAYKLAGNSIVVSCLYHIFRTAFIPGQPENEVKQPLQPSLFD